MNLFSTFSSINYLAVLVAGIVHMAIGLIWFNSIFFGRKWAELTKQELKPAKKWIIAGIIGHQLIALTLALVIYLANATTALEGIAVAITIWLGFVVTLEIGELIWEKIPFKLFMIRIGNHLIALSLSGIILAVWR
jgi:hypothetical protein